jgi:hypothetical protein
MLSTVGLGGKIKRWGADFQKVRAGDSVDIIYEHSSPELFRRDWLTTTTLAFDVEAETVRSALCAVHTAASTLAEPAPCFFR